MGEVDLGDVNPEVQNEGAKSKSKTRSFSLGGDDINFCLLQKAGAEFLGTMFLIIFCVGSANHRALVALGSASPAYYLSISLAFGLGIGGIIHILSGTSGGHVNPAVSFALFLDRRISLIVAIVYIIAQFAGGFAGAGLLYALGNFDDIEGGIAGVNAVGVGINSGQAFFLEMFGTMFLILTILSTINEQKGHAASYLQPLSIGIAILVMHIFLIPFTNCGINPVRGSVWNIITGQANSEILIFLFAPLVGSIISVLVHNIFFVSY
ncbi:aquaporin Z-like isoform X1 [Bolinopsis microptera]|uniref:aquaporin Z-like isoform X1 n=1 Tax=Bolinopsis microptera TaxID=2820187 RepID=UPI00307A7648